MQLSHFLVIFSLNLHYFCQCFPANTEEIKEKSLENIFADTVLWPEHERKQTHEGSDYHFHKDDYFYEEEHHDNISIGIL